MMSQDSVDKKHSDHQPDLQTRLKKAEADIKRVFGEDSTMLVKFQLEEKNVLHASVQERDTRGDYLLDQVKQQIKQHAKDLKEAHVSEAAHNTHGTHTSSLPPTPPTSLDNPAPSRQR